MCKKGCAVQRSIDDSKLSCASPGWGYCLAFPVTILFLSLILCPFSCSAEPIVVSITVNSVPRGDFFVVRDAKGDFLVQREDYAALGLKLPESAGTVEMDKIHYVPLSSLAGFKVEFDEKKLAINVESPVESLPKTTVDLSSPYPSYRNVHYPRENSLFLNYALNYSYSNYSDDPPGGPHEFQVVNKLGARSGDFFFVTDTQYTKNESASDFLRLMSYVTYERPQDLQWITLGDLFAASGGLGSTLNMGGLGISKIYRMNPYLVRQPTLNFSGAAALPSQVDVYVDGILAGRRNIQPGPFEIQNLNYYGGTRKVDLVVRDAFGIEQRFQYSVYFARTLLKNHFHEYSYNIGWLRENYGTKSNDYSEPAFSAFHRYGLSDRLTVGAGAEAADDIYSGSIESTFLVPFSAGVVTMEIAGSSTPSGRGWAGSLSHSYQSGKFGSSAVWTKYSADYATVGSRLSSFNLDYAVGVDASYTTDKWGSFSLGYSRQNARDTGSGKIASAHYTYNLTRSVSIGAGLQAVKTGTDDRDYQFTIDLNYHSPKGLNANANIQSTRDGNLERMHIYKDQPVGEGWGGNVYASRDERKSSETTSIVNPRVQYNGTYGTYIWDSHFQDSGNTRQEIHNLGFAGSVVYAGGFAGLTRPVNDSFSFVTVDRLPDVPVRVNNQEIGRTDPSGVLVVPTLQSYNINDIDLAANDVPMDYRIFEINRKISPSIWSGSCVSLDAQKIAAVSGTLFLRKDGRKTPLEYVEMSVKVGDRNFSYPTGKGGQFYVENVLPEEARGSRKDKYSCRAIAEMRKSGANKIKPGKYPGIVELEGGKCETVITFPETDEAITEIGETECLFVATSAPSPAVPAAPAEGPVPPAPPQALAGAPSAAEEQSEPSTPPLPVHEVSPPQETLAALKETAPAVVPSKHGKCSISFVVQFDTRKARIRKRYYEGLKEIADYLRMHPETGVEICGHSDGVDIFKEPIRNARLSNARAEAVRRYLTDRFGMERSRISAVGYSLHNPVASNKTAQGRRKNRRAEIYVVPMQAQGRDPGPAEAKGPDFRRSDGKGGAAADAPEGAGDSRDSGGQHAGVHETGVDIARLHREGKSLEAPAGQVDPVLIPPSGKGMRYLK